MVEVVPAYSTTAAAVRRWIRGTEQLPKLDDRIFRTEVPESEWKATNTRYAEAQQEVDAAHHRWRVAREMAKVITDELAELDRQHPSSPHDRMSAAIGYVTPADQQRRRLETRLEVAYDRIAEAKVEAEDASNRLWAIRQAMSQGSDGD
jgi:hypothetical protein